MSSTLNLLLITSAFSAVMLLVLLSLFRSKVAGICEWALANGMAVVALVLFAGRGLIADFLSIEVANALLMCATSTMYAGFRRHLGLAVPVRRLAAAVAAAMSVLVFFHYGVDRISSRVVVASLFQSVMAVAIARTIWRGMRAAGRMRYSYVFTAGAALLLTVAYCTRAVVYALEGTGQMPFYEPHSWNLIYFSLGSLALPGLTLGAVMMANEEVIARTRHAADHDYLTGALSRRAFFSQAEASHAHARRSGEPLSLLVFDVDHFKAINDRHGHAVGDEVLVDIVRVAATAVRKGDACARIGGEEFAVLLPAAGATTARTVAERLRRALQRSTDAAEARVRVDYTVSIGLATLEEGEAVSSLLSRADAALYAAKKAGRNAAICAVRCGDCGGAGAVQMCPRTDVVAFV